MNGSDTTTSKEIHKRTGRTFYLATLLLPKRVRRATYVLYAFFRVADEVVDRRDAPAPERQREELEDIRAAALGERDTDDDVLAAFHDLKVRSGIDDAEIDVFIDAMQQDIATERYETHADLDAYMRGSAVAVGNMMMTVMDMDADERERARPHAAALAEAFQLTNFLRDVREDIRDYGRVYMPQETLDEYGVTESHLANGEATEGFAAAMQAELEATEQRYRTGVAGIRYLPDRAQFGVLLAAVLYAEHHRLIRARDYDVLTDPPELGRLRRGWLLLRTWIHWKRSGDPEATFYAVSAIDPETGEGDADAVPGAGQVTSHPV